jgi:catechol 2,3-dioxygenase-like lactoylglutathione lyase family enzyme
MQPYVSVITLGVAELERSKHFYVEGFGWSAGFENEEIVFYQLNGLVLGTFLSASLEADMNRAGLVRPGAFALAHNVRTREEVEPLIARLAAAGGRIVRPADEPVHGGFRGYVADPDDHAWEVAWNPGWPIDADGNLTMRL